MGDVKGRRRWEKEGRGGAMFNGDGSGELTKLDVM